jgi:hypothetical protein
VVVSVAGDRYPEVASLPTPTVRGKGNSPTRVRGRTWCSR